MQGRREAHPHKRPSFAAALAVAAAAPVAEAGGDEEEVPPDDNPMCATFFVKEYTQSCKALFVPDGQRFRTPIRVSLALCAEEANCRFEHSTLHWVKTSMLAPNSLQDWEFSK